MKTLYYFRDLDNQIPAAIGIRPYSESKRELYENLDTPVNLKDDLNWKEVRDLLAIIRGADMWDDFPIAGHTLIAADQKFGQKNQRLDLLYMNTSAELIAGELKIGGTETDTHGQLIRYIADIQQEEISWDWIYEQRNKYLRRLPEITSDIESEKFERFRNRMAPSIKPRFNANKGFILDEFFKSPLTTSLEFLRVTASLDFRAIKISAFGEPDLTFTDPRIYLRLEIA